jgi:hypothetical protein
MISYWWCVATGVVCFIAGFISGQHALVFIVGQIKAGRIRKGKDGDFEVVNQWAPKE